MQQYAYGATVRIDDEEYSIPTNQVTIVLDLPNSEFGETGYISYQDIGGLHVENSELPKEYQERYLTDGEFLICDPIVYREGEEIVVSGNTDFQGMGNPIKLRVYEGAVDLLSNVTETNWPRYKHQFEGYLTEDEAIDPSVKILDQTESDSDDWENGISLDLTNEDDLRRFAEIVDGDFVEDGLAYPPRQTTEASGVVLKNGMHVVPEPDFGEEGYESTDVYISDGGGWFFQAFIRSTIAENVADDDFVIRGDEASFHIPSERTREELGYDD